MSGYDNFFKKAKTASANKENSNNIKKKGKPKVNEPTAEEYLRTALNIKTKTNKQRKSALPIQAVIMTIVGLSLAGAGLLYPHEAESLYNRIEFMAFSSADAADSAKESAESAQTNNADSAENSTTAKGTVAKACTESKGFTEEELSHFNKLNERKNELDLRDAELTTLEEELHKQKKEVEARIVKLEQIRDEVANVLKDRVEVDQQRVSTLVDFYSNMKPKQAAEIVTSLNEDLAVEVLSRMKKKNAADIMNLLDPKKARALSEKFTGYKRR